MMFRSLLFGLTLFLSALLMFLIQPMLGRIVLPLVGGTPAVWNTCMVFFQAVLLAGYAYAHGISARLSRTAQLLIHTGLVIGALATLPYGRIDLPAVDQPPVLLLLRLLVVSIGLPFLVLSTTGPLLQKWFASSQATRQSDPYVLYVASNLGSMLGLLAYPILIEPSYSLTEQCRYWIWAYFGFAGLVGICGIRFRLDKDDARQSPAIGPTEPIASGRRGKWILLAAIPSSLLLGTTAHITSNIAPIPLLWVIPLALYLLSFIWVFSTKTRIPLTLLTRLFTISMVMQALVMLTGATELKDVPMGLFIGLFLLPLFLAAMIFHGRLALDRPEPARLTEFYLCLSIGGVVGGLFNAILAPILFQSTGQTEYPLVLVLACVLLPRVTGDGQPGFVRRDAWLPVVLGVVTAGLIVLQRQLAIVEWPLRVAIAYGLPLVLAYSFSRRPVRFGLGLGALFLACTLDEGAHGKLVYLERDFYGLIRVTEVVDNGERFHRLVHGDTIHGQQSLDQTDSDGRREPLAYYSKKGPAGHLFTRLVSQTTRPMRIGVVGLGTGSLAYYARPNEEWTYYELNPAMQRLAENPRYFSYLSESRAGAQKVVLGDARLRLPETSDGYYDVLVLDAFSSDAIPMHLLTKEALELCQRKLAPGGVIAFHISNRYLDLKRIVARLAATINPALVVYGWEDRHTLQQDRARGALPSIWLVLARQQQDLGPLLPPKNPFWERIDPNPETPLWTDDFSNLWKAFRVEGE